MVALFVLTWSSAFPASKFAMAVSPPLLFLGVRFVVAGLMLLGWAAAFKQLRGPVPWLALAWLGVLNQAGYQGLAWLAMSSISAGLATIIASLTPILVSALAVPMLGERLGWRKAAGLLLGFLGTAYVVRGRIVGAGEDPIGIATMIGALLALTAGTLAFKRMPVQTPIAVSVGVQQVGAGLALFVAGIVTERWSSVQVVPQFWIAMTWFVFVISIGALVLWFLLLRRGTASSASALHFLMPPTGLVMSWAVLGEPIRTADLLGIVPIAAGIWLVTHQPPSPQGRSA